MQYVKLFYNIVLYTSIIYMILKCYFLNILKKYIGDFFCFDKKYVWH